MRIYVQPSYEGGAGNFLNRLSESLESSGEAITRDLASDWEVGLINVVLNPQEQRRVLSHRRPFVLRFDGAPLKTQMLDSIQLHVRALTSYLQCGGIIYQSQSSRDDWRLRLPHGRPETVIHNGIRPDPALHWSPREDLSRDAISFVASLILRYWSQIDFMIEFLDAEERAGRRHRLTIYGTVSSGVEVRLRDDPRVTLVGPIDSRAVRPSLIDHDCFVFLNRHAPCPNAVIEAMSTGMPMLLPEVGAMNELVGETHPTFDLSSPDRVAAMTDVVDRVVGQALRACSPFGESNLSRVAQRFAIDDVAARYLAFLRSCAG